jgi:hypothetical protein
VSQRRQERVHSVRPYLNGNCHFLSMGPVTKQLIIVAKRNGHVIHTFRFSQQDEFIRSIAYYYILPFSSKPQEMSVGTLIVKGLELKYFV